MSRQCARVAVQVLMGALGAWVLLAAATARAEPAPSGRYGIEVACTVDNGMGMCRVDVIDLATGEELFSPQLSSRLGLETSWRASSQLDDGLYSFELTAVIHETWAEVVYMVRRDQEMIQHLVMHMQVGAAAQDSVEP